MRSLLLKTAITGALLVSALPGPSSADSVSACVDKGTGALRIANTCRSSESKITLNTIGTSCSLADLAGSDKIWNSSAAEVTNGQALYNCRFSSDAKGKIARISNGCADTYIGDANFDNPSPYNITSGSIAALIINPAKT